MHVIRNKKSEISNNKKTLLRNFLWWVCSKKITLNRFFRAVKSKKNCLSHDKQSLLTLK